MKRVMQGRGAFVSAVSGGSPTRGSRGYRVETLLEASFKRFVTRG